MAISIWLDAAQLMRMALSVAALTRSSLGAVSWARMPLAGVPASAGMLLVSITRKAARSIGMKPWADCRPSRCCVNVQDVLEAIVHRIPPPKPRDTDKLQALIIDSWFDNYLGVVSLVRVMQGEIKAGDKLQVMSTGRNHQVDNVGVFTPKRKVLPALAAAVPQLAAIPQVPSGPTGSERW